MPAEGRIGLAGLGHALAQAGQQSVDGVAVEAGELGDLNGREIGDHMPQEPAESSPGDS
ncbi:MAG: hypothetical protein ACKVW3_11665 [Phycisphaerales bacterium]